MAVSRIELEVPDAARASTLFVDLLGGERDGATAARQASSRLLSFFRLDYPEIDPEAWRKLLSIRLADGTVSVRDLPLDYYLRPPFALAFEENYLLHCAM